MAQGRNSKWSRGSMNVKKWRGWAPKSTKQWGTRRTGSLSSSKSKATSKGSKTGYARKQQTGVTMKDVAQYIRNGELKVHKMVCFGTYPVLGHGSGMYYLKLPVSQGVLSLLDDEAAIRVKACRVSFTVQVKGNVECEGVSYIADDEVSGTEVAIEKGMAWDAGVSVQNAQGQRAYRMRSAAQAGFGGRVGPYALEDSVDGEAFGCNFRRGREYPVGYAKWKNSLEGRKWQGGTRYRHMFLLKNEMMQAENKVYESYNMVVWWKYNQVVDRRRPLFIVLGFRSVLGSVDGGEFSFGRVSHLKMQVRFHGPLSGQF